MTRYRAEDPPRRSGLRTVGRILLWIAIAVRCWSSRSRPALPLVPRERGGDPGALGGRRRSAQKFLGEPPAPGHAAIGLVIGYDHRANEAANTPSRSDTVMLIRTDPSTKTVSMMSFPRDLLRQRPLPGTAGLLGQDQLRLRRLRREGHRPDGQRHDRPADQLPDHGQLPRASSRSSTGSAASGSTSTAATSTTTPDCRRRSATRRSTCSRATSCSPAAAPSTTSATATPTPTCSGSPASSSS